MTDSERIIQDQQATISRLTAENATLLERVARILADWKAGNLAWLIEFRKSVSATPRYYGKTVEGLGLTEENLDAIRFSRKQDAEAVIADNGWTECDAIEHMWS